MNFQLFLYNGKAQEDGSHIEIIILKIDLLVIYIFVISSFKGLKGHGKLSRINTDNHVPI